MKKAIKQYTVTKKREDSRNKATTNNGYIEMMRDITPFHNGFKYCSKQTTKKKG